MPPKIAVITPYYKEPVEFLRQCHDSVLSQTVPATHFMIADGHPCAEIDNWDVAHIPLNTGHADYGNTPRGVGGFLARNQGFDFVAYLDADNWFQPEHLASLLQLHQSTGADVSCSYRTFHRLDGSLLPVTEPMEDKRLHVDTNCMFFSKKAFEVLDVWLKMPKEVASLGDRVVYAAIRHKRLSIAFTNQRTIAYRTLYAYHYQLAKEPVPEQTKGHFFNDSFKWLKTPQGVIQSEQTLGFWPLPYLA